MKRQTDRERMRHSPLCRCDTDQWPKRWARECWAAGRGRPSCCKRERRWGESCQRPCPQRRRTWPAPDSTIRYPSGRDNVNVVCLLLLLLLLIIFVFVCWSDDATRDEDQGRLRFSITATTTKRYHQKPPALLSFFSSLCSRRPCNRINHKKIKHLIQSTNI